MAVVTLLLAFVAVTIVASLFVDEPLRRMMEGQINDRLRGYTAHIERLSFQPLGLSLTLYGVRMSQDARPDPPVLRVIRLDASVHWKALLFGRLVADFRIEAPHVYVDRKQAEAEADDPTPLAAHGWQDAVQAIYPLKINELEIVNGEVTYVEEGPFAPLRLRQVNVRAENIRNVRSEEGEFPSPVRIDAVVFETGSVSIDGHADFLAEPDVALRAAITLEQIDLAYFRAVTDRYNVSLRRGAVSAQGLVEYTSRAKVVDLQHAVVRDAVVDYVHVPAAAGKVGQAAAATVATARETANAPDLLVRAREIDVVNADVGIVNRTVKPPFRLFLANTQLRLENFSNRLADGGATARLQGRFMGSGRTVVVATFRPETSGPDFDVDIKIENTDMRSMNDILRAYGKFDVAAGQFSLYSQLAVRNDRIAGYVKPLFSDVRAFDPEQDRDKGFLRRLYERIVGGVSKILKNSPRDEVATVVDISGPLPDPSASTLQAVGNLVRNAFFKAILPGFDREGRAPRR